MTPRNEVVYLNILQIICPQPIILAVKKMNCFQVYPLNNAEYF